MRLWKISYTSIATLPEETANADTLVICALSEQYNALHGITGVLTLHRGRFAQVLEGPETALRALMARIKADPRHHTIKVISDGPIVKRRYADWSMAYRDPKTFVTDQLNDVLEQTAEVTRALGATWH
ncbi:BLUF domain-containing protein [Novosphingobium sp.]|uniref:BLUF domain-containing protein n=1 Tax=Novosphingobium sp. TaxID=1874826 RepID=UPI00262984C3|nr:BLUF domain-containing protein [Novosphingobium sp.]